MDASPLASNHENAEGICSQRSICDNQPMVASCSQIYTKITTMKWFTSPVCLHHQKSFEQTANPGHLWPYKKTKKHFGMKISYYGSKCEWTHTGSTSLCMNQKPIKTVIFFFFSNHYILF